MVETIKKLVGNRFRSLRKRAGFVSAEAAAEALGVHPNSVYELERGDNWISPEMLNKAIDVFQVPAPHFFGDQEPIRPTPSEALDVLAKAIAKPGLSSGPADLVALLSTAGEAEWAAVRVALEGTAMGKEHAKHVRNKKLKRKDAAAD